MNNQTVKELKEIAYELEIPKVYKLRKSELISTIKRKKNITVKNMSFIVPVSIVRQNKWTLYSKVGCGFCKKAKNLFATKGINYDVYDIEDKDKSTLFNQIDHLTGSYRTFPIIFKNGKFIGGYSNLEKII